MSEKPEALRLAEELDAFNPFSGALLQPWLAAAAAKLRSQHAENERLREALEIIAGCRQCVDPLMGNQDVARAALRREDEK